MGPQMFAGLLQAAWQRRACLLAADVLARALASPTTVARLREASEMERDMLHTALPVPPAASAWRNPLTAAWQGCELDIEWCRRK